jgi:hypothetical protein
VEPAMVPVFMTIMDHHPVVLARVQGKKYINQRLVRRSRWDSGLRTQKDLDGFLISKPARDLDGFFVLGMEKFVQDLWLVLRFTDRLYQTKTVN